MEIFPCEAQTTLVHGLYTRYKNPRHLVAKILYETEENNLYACLLKCGANKEVKMNYPVEKNKISSNWF